VRPLHSTIHTPTLSCIGRLTGGPTLPQHMALSFSPMGGVCLPLSRGSSLQVACSSIALPPQGWMFKRLFGGGGDGVSSSGAGPSKPGPRKVSETSTGGPSQQGTCTLQQQAAAHLCSMCKAKLRVPSAFSACREDGWRNPETRGCKRLQTNVMLVHAAAHVIACIRLPTLFGCWRTRAD
jgi:hypothetical protein